MFTPKELGVGSLPPQPSQTIGSKALEMYPLTVEQQFDETHVMMNIELLWGQSDIQDQKISALKVVYLTHTKKIDMLFVKENQRVLKEEKQAKHEREQFDFMQSQVDELRSKEKEYKEQINTMSAQIESLVKAVDEIKAKVAGNELEVSKILQFNPKLSSTNFLNESKRIASTFSRTSGGGPAQRTGVSEVILNLEKTAISN